jgi:hypothetical protein
MASIFDTLLSVFNKKNKNKNGDRNTTGSTVQSQAQQQSDNATGQNRRQGAQSYSANLPAFNQRPQQTRRSFSVNTPSYNQQPQISGTVEKKAEKSPYEKLVQDMDKLNPEKQIKKPTVQENADDQVTANNISEKMFGRKSATKALADMVTDASVNVDDYSKEEIENAKDLYSKKEQHLLDILNIDPNSDDGKRLMAKMREGDANENNWQQYLPKEYDKNLLIRTGTDIGLGAQQVADSLKGLDALRKDLWHYATTGDATPDISDRDRRMHDFNQLENQNTLQRTGNNWYDQMVMNMASNVIRNQFTGSVLGNMGLVDTGPGKALGMGALGASSFGNAYGDMRYDDGATIGSSALYGLATGGSEMLQELIPGGKIQGAEHINLNLNDAIGEFRQEAFGAAIDPFVETLRTNSPVNDFNGWLNAMGTAANNYYRDENGNVSLGQIGQNLGRIAKEGGISGLSSLVGGGAAYAADTLNQYATDRRVHAISKDLADAVRLYKEIVEQNAPAQQQTQQQTQPSPQQLPQLDLSGAMARSADDAILQYPEQNLEEAQWDREDAINLRASNTTEEINREYGKNLEFSGDGKLKNALDAYVSDMFGGDITDDTAIGNGGAEYLKTMRSALADGALMSSNAEDRKNAQIANEYIIRASAERHNVDIDDATLGKLCAISNRIGIPFEFLPAEMFDKYYADGWYAPGPRRHGLRTGVIQLPSDIRDSVDGLVTTFLHEVTHTTEGTPEYFRLKKALMEIDNAKFDSFTGEFVEKIPYDVGGATQFYDDYYAKEDGTFPFYSDKDPNILAYDRRHKHGTEHFANLVGNFVERIYRNEKKGGLTASGAADILDRLGKPGEDFDPLEFIKTVYDTVTARSSTRNRDRAIKTVEKLLGRAMDASKYASEYQKLLYDSSGLTQLERRVEQVRQEMTRKGRGMYRNTPLGDGYTFANGTPITYGDAQNILNFSLNAPYNGKIEYETPYDLTYAGEYVGEPVGDEYKKYALGDDSSGWRGVGIIPRDARTANERKLTGDVRADEVNQSKLFDYDVTHASFDDLREANRSIDPQQAAKDTKGVFTEDEVAQYLGSSVEDFIVEQLPNKLKQIEPSLSNSELSQIVDELVKNGRMTQDSAEKISFTVAEKVRSINEVASAIKSLSNEQAKALAEVENAPAKKAFKEDQTPNMYGLSEADIVRISNLIEENGGYVDSALRHKLVDELGYDELKPLTHTQIWNIYGDYTGQGTIAEDMHSSPHHHVKLHFNEHNKAQRERSDVKKGRYEHRDDGVSVKELEEAKKSPESIEAFEKTLFKQSEKRDEYEMQSARDELMGRIKRNERNVIGEDKGGHKFVINTKTNVFTGMTVSDVYHAIKQDIAYHTAELHRLEPMRTPDAMHNRAVARDRRKVLSYYASQIEKYGEKSDVFKKLGYEVIHDRGKAYMGGKFIDDTYERFDDALDLIEKIEQSNDKPNVKRRKSIAALRLTKDDKQFPHFSTKDNATLKAEAKAEAEAKANAKAEAQAKKENAEQTIKVVVDNVKSDKVLNDNAFKAFETAVTTVRKGEEKIESTTAKMLYRLKAGITAEDANNLIKNFNEKAMANIVSKLTKKNVFVKGETLTEAEASLLVHKMITEEAATNDELEDIIEQMFGEDNFDPWFWKKKDKQLIEDIVKEQYLHSTKEPKYIFTGRGDEIIERETGRIIRNEDGSIPDTVRYRNARGQDNENNLLTKEGVLAENKKIAQTQKDIEHAEEVLDAASPNARGPKEKQLKVNVRSTKSVLANSLASLYLGEEGYTHLDKAASHLETIWHLSPKTANELAKNIVTSSEQPDSKLYARAAKEAASNGGNRTAKEYAERFAEAKKYFGEEAIANSKRRSEIHNFSRNAKEDLERRIEEQRLKDKEKHAEWNAEQRAKAEAEAAQNEQAPEEAKAEPVKPAKKEDKKAKGKTKKKADKETSASKKAEAVTEEAKASEQAEAETKPTSETKSKEAKPAEKKIEKLEKRFEEPTAESLVNAVKEARTDLTEAEQAALNEALEATKEETDGAEFNSTFAQALHRLGASVKNANAMAESVIKKGNAKGTYNKVHKEIVKESGLSKKEAGNVMAEVRRAYHKSIRALETERFAGAKLDKSKQQAPSNTETTAKATAQDNASKTTEAKTTARTKAKATVKKASDTAKKVKGKDFTDEQKQIIEDANTAANEKEEKRAEETAKKIDEKIEADNKKAEEAKKTTTKKKPQPKSKTAKTSSSTSQNNQKTKTGTQQQEQAKQEQPKQEQTNQQEQASQQEQAQQEQTGQQEQAQQGKTGEQMYDETIKTGEDHKNYSKDFSTSQTVERLLKDRYLSESFKQRLKESYLYKAVKHDSDVRKNAKKWLEESGVEGAVEYAKYVDSENGTVNEEGVRYMIEAIHELNSIADVIQNEIAKYEKAMEDNGYEVSDPGIVGFKRDGKHVKEFTDKNGNGVFNAETWEALKDEQHKRLEQAATISTTMLEASSESARILRIMRELHDNPLTAKTYLEKVIARLNRIYEKDLTDRHGNVKKLTLDSKLADKYLSAKTEEEREKIMDDIEYAIADQLPRHAKDMIRQWRMTMMLVNPKTHMRNILSNYLTKGVFRLNDVTQSAVEHVLVKSGIIKETDRRAAIIVKSEYMRAAEALDKLDKYSVEKRGQGDKFNLYDAKLAAGAFSNKNRVGRSLNALAKWNRDLLEYEDYEMALKGRAHLSLAMALQSGGYTVEQKGDSVIVKKGNEVLSDEDLKALEAHALQNAQESTFHDANAVAEFLETLKKRKLGMAVDVIVPFTKTPANILRRGRDFSPIGLTKAVTLDLWKVTHGQLSASSYVTRLSRGITGTGLYLLGMFLGNMGLLAIPDDDDEEERESYYRGNIFGKQNMALHVGDRYYSIDWAMPTAMPIMMGAAIAHTTQAVRKNILNEPLDVILSVIKDTETGLGAVLEASYLNSIEDIVSSISQGYNYGGQWFGAGGMGAFERGVTGVVENFAGQMTPTIGGAINRTFDPKKRTTSGNTVEKRILNRSLMNIPGLSGLLEPAVDQKGNELSNIGLFSDGVIGKALYNGLFPSNITVDTHDELDSALMDVGAPALPRNQTGHGGLKGQIYADLSKNGLKIGAISDKEYTQVKKTYYGNYREYAKAYNELAEYNRLGTHTRDNVYAKLEQLALNEAKATYYDKVGSVDNLYTKEQKVAIALKKYGVSPAQFFLIKDNGLKGNRAALYVMSELENLGVADEVINDIMQKKYFPSDVGLTDSVVLKTADEREEAREEYLSDDEYVSLESQVARYRSLSTEEYEEKQKSDKEKSREESWEEFFEKVDKKYGTNFSKGGTKAKSKGGRRSGSRRSSGGSSSSSATSADLELYNKIMTTIMKEQLSKKPSASIKSTVDLSSDAKIWDTIVNGSKKDIEALKRELKLS